VFRSSCDRPTARMSRDVQRVNGGVLKPLPYRAARHRLNLLGCTSTLDKKPRVFLTGEYLAVFNFAEQSLFIRQKNFHELP
jgi:hypothetical protein